MYTLKGFITIPSRVNNETRVTSVFGELSTFARTYSYEQKMYRNSTYQGVLLEVFASKTAEVANVDIETSTSDVLLEIAHWLHGQATAGSISTDGTVLATNLLAQFSSEIEQVDVGEILEIDTVRLPAFVSFKLSNYGEDNYIKLWFGNEAFLTQYDEYEIKPLMPVEDLSVFQTMTHQELAEELKKNTIGSMLDALADTIADAPCTKPRSAEFTWVDPTDSSLTHTTPWGVAIYGRAGDNIDNIRRALTEAVLAELPQYTREDWIEVLPDLFRSNEFIVVPQWTAYAVPTESQQGGVYSSSMKLADVISRHAQFYPEYPEAHLAAQMYSVTTPYNFLESVIVGGPENKDGEYDFKEKWSDYFSIDASEPDFNRMSTLTQSFSETLRNLMVAAETVTDFSQLPDGINRINRSGLMYVSASVDSVEYLVLSRKSYLEVLDG